MTPTHKRFDFDAESDAETQAGTSPPSIASSGPTSGSTANRSSDDEDPRLLAAVQEYLAAVEAGKRVNRQEFVARHPDIAAELSDCLDGLAFVNSAAAKIQDPGGSGQANAAADSPNVDPHRSEPLGDFRLIREIGRGGMGVVYEAVQLSLGRRVAVKVLPLASAFDPRHLQRFRNEAQAAAQLHHSNIVPVYAVGSERGVHFYAMQLIEGQSLEDVIRELRAGAAHPAVGRPPQQGEEVVGDNEPTATWRPPVAGGAAAPPATRPRRSVPPAQRPTPRPASGSAAANSATSTGSANMVAGGAILETLPSLHSQKRQSFYRSVARLALQAADALEYAHQLGVVHRDIKPANLMLDVRGNLWITDFGLAQFYAESGGLTQTGDILGTLRYMSPEQAGGRAVVLDQRTDVYSLGMTIYELLTLERALPGVTREQLLHEIGQVDPRPARSIDKSIPPELETILGKAAAKEPSDRYASAGALADDLRRFLRDEPILARPPSLRDKAVKWTRRHRAVAVSAVAMLVLATAGLLTSTLLIAGEQSKTKAALVRERDRATEANEQRTRADQQRLLADEQRARAEQNYQQARAAVDFFTRIAKDEMGDPRLADVRTQMLEAALGYYQGFLQQHRDDSKIENELTQAQTQVRLILSELAAFSEFGRVGERARLLEQDAIQKELALPDERADVMKDYMRQFWNRDGKVEPWRMSPAERAAWFEESAEATKAKLEEVLTPDQGARLRQIWLQARGPAAFADPDIVEILHLTTSQKEAVRKSQDQYRAAKIQQWLARESEKKDAEKKKADGERGGDDDDHMDRRNEKSVPPWEADRVLRDRWVQAILAQLTPAQAGTWKQLVGEPFTGPVFLHGQGPGGPGGPGGGRGDRGDRDDRGRGGRGGRGGR